MLADLRRIGALASTWSVAELEEQLFAIEESTLQFIDRW